MDQTMRPETSDRKGDFIFTFTGKRFYPIDPRPEEIDIRDIAHALSMQCRYTGHVSRFLSVAEHSLGVASLLPQELKLAGLMHDASEAYLADIARPIKHCSDFGDLYRVAEHRLMGCIAEKFGLDFDHPLIKEADDAMIYVEANALMPPDPCWAAWYRPILAGHYTEIFNYTPERADLLFRNMYDRLNYQLSA